MSIAVAVVGASTLLGENLLEILADRNFPVTDIRLADVGEITERSVMFKGHATRIRSLEKTNLAGVGILFNCKPEGLTKQDLQQLLNEKVTVIDLCPSYDADLSHCWIPSIGNQDAATMCHEYIVSPSSAAIVTAMALSALNEKYKVLRLNLTCLNSVAEAGRDGVEALALEASRLLNGRPAEGEYFGQQIAFNILPAAGPLSATGESLEEQSLVSQVQSLLKDDQLEIMVSALQVPLFYGQCVVVHAECQHPVDLDHAAEILGKVPDLTFSKSELYSPVTHAAGQDGVFVSRLRIESNSATGFALCAVTDNLRKGGALNAVQIAEEIVTLLDRG